MLNGNIGEILWGGRTEKCAVQKSSALREKGHELYLVESDTCHEHAPRRRACIARG
jgi:hypothetical protein